jgi:aldehyde dehydrogenase (NAD+)
LLTTWKLAPALAAGNAVVIKPSEHASVSMVEFAKLFLEAGFPAGVVNVVTGFGTECGATLVEHPKVAKVAFTGGDGGGRAVYQAAAKNLKHVTLELGGKSPNIVCEDADIEQAVKGAVSGIFAATGQTCMAGSRLLVHETRHDEFVAALRDFVAAAKLGDPMDRETKIGPIATLPQYEKVLDYIDIAKGEGARVAYGGKPYRGAGCENGWFVEPTVLTEVSNTMRVAREEIFGPVLSVIRFKDDEEAIAIANDTPYGLAAGVWTKDLVRAFRYTKELKAGTVWVNAYRVVSYAVPFGGFKQSGIGRENGQEMIKEYLQSKSVFINLDKEVPNPFVLR